MSNKWWEEEFEREFVDVTYGTQNHTKSLSDIDGFIKTPNQVKAFISKVERKTRESVVEKTFNWIWDGWNLDLSKIDRAREHFLTTLSKTKVEEIK